MRGAEVQRLGREDVEQEGRRMQRFDLVGRFERGLD